ncbi:MAG: tRNA pseudouridine(38-40) synthase TruA [Bacteriovoracia bacterium]
MNDLKLIKHCLIISYDGTHFYGYQRQVKNNVDKRTIQSELEKALLRLYSIPISALSSGRTDAGVHARVQVVGFRLPHTHLDRYSLERLALALNAVLPLEIRVQKVLRMPDSFHVIKDVKKKTYIYFVNNGFSQKPWLRNYAWHLRLPIDWEKVRMAAKTLEGRHDFKSFCAANSSAKTTVRTIFEARCERVEIGQFLDCGPQMYAIRLTGSGFLKQMVRTIAGTLIQLGQNKLTQAQFEAILAANDRKKAGLTAPAHGLWLWDIQY